MVLGPEHFRRELLAYLSESEFSEPVRALAGRLDPADWIEMLARVDGPDDLAWLLGACRRELEEQPSHAGLLLLAGVSRLARAASQQGPGDLGNSMVALRAAFADPTYRAGIIAQLAPHAKRLAPAQWDTALYALLEADPTVSLARFCALEAQAGSAAHQLAIKLLQTERAA
jgi:hypothetical protein